MSIRDKLLDFKRRLSDRKMYSIVVVAIAAVSVWGIYQYKRTGDLRQQLDNQYNRSFYDMVGYVDNVDTLLSKALITSTPERTASILQEAWRQSNLAQTDLGQLPISQQVLANTSKFLTQVGDLAYSLNNQNMQGKALTDNQYKTLQQLQGFSTSLKKSIGGLQNDLSTGRLKWNELAKKGTPTFQKASKKLPTNQFENLDKTFQKYPTLIYDGPFSDHMATSQPKGLTGSELNSEQAKKSVVDLFGAGKVKAITLKGKNNTGPIKTFSYNVTFKNQPDDRSANIDITQKGGQVFWMLYNRPVEKEKINVDQAKVAGRKFLDDHGYKGMIDTYYLKEDNTATINYAYKQGNVVIYPDLIKLKIALDNGEVVGFEAKSYIAAHTARTLPTPKITMQQARAKISPRVNVLSSGLAIIPTEFKTEIFTYEFKGKLNNRDFLVYINADTGREENILMIVNTPNGILTM